MAMYFVDTCVWRDFWEDRTGHNNYALGRHAYFCITKILRNKDIILYNEDVIHELRTTFSNYEISSIFGLLVQNNILQRIDVTTQEHEEAVSLCKERKAPINDCLFAIQARNHNAIIITQDKHFFNELKDIVLSIRPQDLD